MISSSGGSSSSVAVETQSNITPLDRCQITRLMLPIGTFFFAALAMNPRRNE